MLALSGIPVLILRAIARPAFAASAWPLHPSVRIESNDGTAWNHEREEAAGPAFRVLTVATVISIFALVTLGGVVRLTGSGLGCPDWPLCHGKLIPPLDTPTLIEYSHRLMASVVGVLVVVTALVVWRLYRGRPWLLVPAILGLILLVVQVLLGGLTVLRELPSGIVLAHLATGEALMASMVVVCIVAICGRSASGFRGAARTGRDWFPILTLGTVLAAYALLLTGSHMAVSGATTACGQQWPLCQGQFLPEGYYPMIHMLHRLVAVLVGALIVGVLVLAWRRKGERRLLGWTAVAVGVAFLGQVMVGAAVLWMEFPTAARALHLATATLVWAGLAVLAVFAYTAPRASVRGVSRA